VRIRKLNSIQIKWFNSIVCWLVIDVIDIVCNIIVFLCPWIVFQLNCIEINRFDSVVSRLVIHIIKVVTDIIIVLSPWFVFNLDSHRVLLSSSFGSSYTFSISLCSSVQSGSSLIFELISFPRSSLEIESRGSWSNMRHWSILNVSIIIRCFEHIVVPLSGFDHIVRSCLERSISGWCPGHVFRGCNVMKHTFGERGWILLEKVFKCIVFLI